LTPPRIILIEDEPDISLLASFTLDTLGYEVLSADNGENGLELVEKSLPVSLIILDIMMPGIDGYQVLERLKADPDYKDIPVLIFSAMAQESEVRRGYSLGAAGYVKKPFDAEQMITEVERFFSNGNGNT